MQTIHGRTGRISHSFTLVSLLGIVQGQIGGISHSFTLVALLGIGQGQTGRISRSFTAGSFAGNSEETDWRNKSQLHTMVPMLGIVQGGISHNRLRPLLWSFSLDQVPLGACVYQNQ